MGCDIHLYMEVYNEDKWVDANLYEINEYYKEYSGCSEERMEFLPIPPYRNRNYELFGIFAGVRNQIMKPISPARGIPEDVTSKIEANFIRLDSDAHSSSWLTLAEIKDYQENHKYVKRKGYVSPEVAARVAAGGEKPDSWCGRTNREDWVEIEWEDKLKCIDWFVESVEQYIKVKFQWNHVINEYLKNPEKVRFVFWFDN